MERYVPLDSGQRAAGSMKKGTYLGGGRQRQNESKVICSKARRYSAG